MSEEVSMMSEKQPADSPSIRALSFSDRLLPPAGYLVLFAILQWLPPDGVTLWSPLPGLDFAFLLAFGLALWPVVAVAHLLSSWANQTQSVTLAAGLVGAAVSVGTPLLMALLYRSSGLSRHPSKLSDWAGFSVAAASGSVVLAQNQLWLGATSAQASWLASTSLATMSNALGILVVAPFLLVHLVPWIHRRHRSSQAVPTPSSHRVGWSESAAQGVVLIAIIWIVFVLAEGSVGPIRYFCFVPLIWIALRHGAGGAVAASTILTTSAVVWMAPALTAVESAETQGLLLALTLTGLFLGTAFNQRRRALDQLELEKIYLERLFQSAPEAVVIVDNESRILQANDEFTRMFGYQRDEYLGRRVDRLIIPEGLHDEAASLTGRIAKQGSLTLATTRCRKDGSIVKVSILAAPIHFGGGQVALYGIYRDVTLEHDLEDRLRQAQKMEAVGRLAGGVAHDFNNLLTAILGYAELLGDDVTAGKGAGEFVKEIRRAANRAKALTSQLLAFSRKQVLTPKVIALDEIVANLEPMLERLLGENIELNFHHAGPARTIRADPGQIEQVIVNLAVNARDALPDGGVIQLEIEELALDDEASAALSILPGRYVQLRFRDNGTGMTSEVLNHIFEPFYTTKEYGKGTGLGLATVYGIVKQSGGHIDVESRPGRGTTFVIYFPHASAEQEAESKARPGTARNHETILVVDEEVPIRKLIAETLRSEGYQVLEAGDGSKALLAAESFAGQIRLLLTSVVMPGISGRELSVRLRAQRPRLKTIFVSGFADEVPDEEASAFLQKPFSPETLLLKVEEIVKEGRDGSI